MGALAAIKSSITIDELDGYTMFVDPKGAFLISDSERSSYIPLVRKEGSKIDGARLLLPVSYRGQNKLQVASVVNKFKNALEQNIEPRIVYGTKEVTEYFINKGGVNSEFHSFSSDFQENLSDYVKFALKNNASDIHIEANENNKGRVRMRINGDLMTYITDAPYEQQISFMRYIYSNLTKGGDQSFNENVAQNGVISALKLPGLSETRLRVATSKTVVGADMVFRLLPISKMEKSVPLSDLGYTEKQVSDLLDAMNAPSGLLLVAGTTGSGKSTTMANLLTMKVEKDEGRSKIYTVEDPVEFKLEGVSQIPVSASYDGADPWVEAIRACLRLDPDMLMVGELRDNESANLVKDFAQTGHPALSTIHAASGLIIPERLASLGLSRDVLAQPSFLNIIAKQNLLKVVCPHCAFSIPDVKNRMDYSTVYLPILQRLKRIADYLEDDLRGIKFVNREGACSHCDGISKGISGRTVVAEVISPDKTMRELFKDPANAEKLKAYWLQNYPGEAQLDIAWKRVVAGLVDPFEAEHVFERFDKIKSRNNEYGID